MRFKGTNGDDDFSGTAGKDKFDMSQGGDDNVFGQGGKDLFYFGAAFTADDSIDGGVKTVDHKVKVLGTVELNGDYSAGVVFGAETMTNIGHLVLDQGFSYNLTFNQTTVASGRDMTIDGLALGAGDSLVIDAAADTDGHFIFKTNAAHADLTGGSQFDAFYLGATLDESDHIDGGTNTNNDLFLRGDYSGTILLDSSWISNIGEIQLGVGHYSFVATDTFNPGLVTITGGNGGEVVANFDGSAETTAKFEFRNLIGTEKGGAGDDVLSGITGSAIGNGGNDFFSAVHGTADGGSGNDTFIGVQGTILGGSGNDIYTNDSGTFDAGTGDDTFNICSGTFHLEQSGRVVFDASDLKMAADATLYFGATYSSSDWVIGGLGVDTVVFDGNYSALTLIGENFSVEKLVLVGGHSYNLAVDHDIHGASAQLAIDASDLGTGDILTFSGVQTQALRYAVTGGDGNDHITTYIHDDVLNGGAGDDYLNGFGGRNKGDILDGGLGADTIIGGHNSDVFVYGPAQDSQSTHFDTVTNFNIATNIFDVSVAVTGVDHFISGGALDSTTGDAAFDADLAAALNGHLTAHHAIVFTPDSGNLAGDVFLIVDQNGVAGYQGGEDLVIRLDGGANLTDINFGNFG